MTARPRRLATLLAVPLLALGLSAAATAATASPSATSATSATSAGATHSLPAAAQQTRAVGLCQHLVVEPKHLVSACGDFGTYLLVQHYSFWHDDAAAGRGRLVVNECDPNCAAGHYQRTPVTFRLGAVKQTKNGPVFSRAALTYHRHGRVGHESLYLPTRPE